jgi:hypothetical protein
LLGLARDDGLTVLLVHTPLRSQYVDAERRLVPAAMRCMREHVAALETMYGAHATIIERGTDVGIPDNRYYDYGHLAEDGTRRMVPVWVSLLRPYLGI